MFASELQSRARKLEAEQKQRIEKEKHRLEKERLLKERQKQRELARVEEARRKRLEEARRQELEEERIAALREANRGVFFEESLQAAPLEESASSTKGIRRAKDKIVLPASASKQLLDQDAPKNGAMLFEVSTPWATRTHAGVLDFTAPEGVVLLPLKVSQCLFGLEEPQPRGAVTVCYKRLEKGSFVKLQPRSRDFHAAADDGGDDLKAVLEGALHAYCTLSEGDWLQVSRGGRQHDLQVLELQPEPQVSIIDTDVEAEVGPSLETEQYLQQRQEQLERQQQYLRQVQEQQEQEEQRRLHDQLAAQQQAEQQAAAAAARREAERRAKAARLPPEPAAECAEPHTACLFRLPDGGRSSRRFLLSQPLQLLFDFVDSIGAGGLEFAGYQLVTQYPRRVFGPGSAGSSLQELGFSTGQEVLLLEPVK